MHVNPTFSINVRSVSCLAGTIADRATTIQTNDMERHGSEWMIALRDRTHTVIVFSQVEDRNLWTSTSKPFRRPSVHDINGEGGNHLHRPSKYLALPDELDFVGDYDAIRFRAPSHTWPRAQGARACRL